MRNFKKILMVLIMALALVTLAGCGGKKDPNKPNPDKPVVPETTYYNVVFDAKGGSEVEKQRIEEGKVATEPTAPTKENYTFLGWYVSETTTEENLYKFDTPVTKDITLYAGWEVKTQILVLAVEQNSQLIEFGANKAEKENKKTEFFDRTQVYLVGDDNAFSVKPETSFINYNPITEETEPVIVKSWEYQIKVFMLDGTKATEVTENSEYIEAIDKVNCTIDFADTAVDTMYRVEVVPTGLTEKQLAKVNEYTTTFEFKVIDGYNIYEAKELAYMENRTKGAEADAWKAFKEENKLALDLAPRQLIVHKDLEIKVTDLPTFFFYQESELSKTDPDYARALGSMKDNKTIYHRDVNEKEDFILSGNYFTISSATLKEVVRESGKVTPEGEVISHAVLFLNAGKGTSRMENINFIGNAPRVENAIKAGGHILHKAEETNFTAYNLLTACYFITYFPESTSVTDLKGYTIEKCKAYDAFNCFVYNWGSKTLVIKDSEMIGAGGPIIIQDHVHPDKKDEHRDPKTVVLNSKLESYVTGNEGWFTVVKASAIVPQIKKLDAIFNTVGRSFLKSNGATGEGEQLTFFNFISITKSGSAEGVTAEKVDGSLTLNDKTFDFGATNPYLKGMLDLTFKANAPTFETNKSNLQNGIGYFNGKALIDATNQPIADPTNPLFSGDYLCVYYSGMQLVVGYGPMGEIHTTNEF